MESKRLHAKRHFILYSYDLSDDIFIVSDTTLDPRFKNNLLVTGELGIRFYAGAPLITKSGFRLGSLCVIDRIPRTISDEQRSALGALARQVMALLELRAAISIQTKLHSELTTSNAKLHTLSSNAPLAIFGAEISGGLTYANPAFVAIAGIPEESLLGDGWAKAIHPDDRERVVKEWTIAAAQGSQFLSVHRFVTPSGLNTLCKVAVTPFRDSGQVTGYIGIVENIAERDALEKKILKERQRFELAITGGNLGLWDWDLVTNYAVFNSRWAEIVGEELQNISPSAEEWLSRVHPDDLPIAREAIERHFSGERPYCSCVHRLRHKNGSWVWVLGHGQVFERAADGTPLRMVGTELDITEKVEFDRSMEEKRNLLDETQSIGKIGSWVFSPKTGSIQWSD